MLESDVLEGLDKFIEEDKPQKYSSALLKKIKEVLSQIPSDKITFEAEFLGDFALKSNFSVLSNCFIKINCKAKENDIYYSNPTSKSTFRKFKEKILEDKRLIPTLNEIVTFLERFLKAEFDAKTFVKNNYLSIEYKGVKFNFTDTAGIRESSDKIEAIGVSTSKKILGGSDLIVFILDGGNITNDDEEIYNLVKDKNTLVVINKTDKPYKKDDRAEIYVSATENSNINELKEKIFQKTIGNGLDLNGNFLCEERHYNALLQAKDKLVSALNNLSVVPLDLIAIDIKDSWESMGEISGKTATEDIINEIFSRFCVGK